MAVVSKGRFYCGGRSVLRTAYGINTIMSPWSYIAGDLKIKVRQLTHTLAVWDQISALIINMLKVVLK